MYVAPIEFEDIIKWFKSTNHNFSHFCVFLNGNGEYDDVICEAILSERFLIDRTTGNGICYFYCTESSIENDITDFNQWHVRNKRNREYINNNLGRCRFNSPIPRLKQSELLREDICSYYDIKRSDLPALAFIDKGDKVLLYPVKSFQDIRGLLTPLGIISDFMEDRDVACKRIEKIHALKKETDRKTKLRDELTTSIVNELENIKPTQSLINEIIDICANNGTDEATLKKMRKNPEKIRQILSIHIITPSLSPKLHLLKGLIPQYRKTRKKLHRYQNEIAQLEVEPYTNYENDLMQERRKLDEYKSIYAKKLDELELGIDTDSITEQVICRQADKWLFSILEASKKKITGTEKHYRTDHPNDEIVLKCFIAGSKQLERERDAIISGINDQNHANKHTKRRIECYTFKNFKQHFVSNGQQKEYNDFIRNDADIVIFALDEVIGGITREEFDNAVEALQKSEFEKPIILVFSNTDNPNETHHPDIQVVKQRVNELKQYWIDYSSIETLKLKLQLSVNMVYTK